LFDGNNQDYVIISIGTKGSGSNGEFNGPTSQMLLTLYVVDNNNHRLSQKGKFLHGFGNERKKKN